MKSTVEHLNPTRVKLTVEVPFDELKPHFDKAYGTLAGQVRIPGFRPGKVPARILDARLGRGTILSEVVNEAVPAKYGEAVTEANLTVLGQPEIEVTRIDDGDALAFTAEVDVRPEITLPDARSVGVTVDDVEVTEADIDEQVEALRDRFASTTAVDRAAADGDLVSIDLVASVDGEVLDEATTEGLTYTVGPVTWSTASMTPSQAWPRGRARPSTQRWWPASSPAGTPRSRSPCSRCRIASCRRWTTTSRSWPASSTPSRAAGRPGREDPAGEKPRPGCAGQGQGVGGADRGHGHPTPESIVDAEFKSREHDAVHAFDHDEDALDRARRPRGPDQGRVRRRTARGRGEVRQGAVAARRAGRGEPGRGQPGGVHRARDVQRATAGHRPGRVLLPAAGRQSVGGHLRRGTPRQGAGRLPSSRPR